jgi:multicomponent Na+:H+ antiporter subunit D
VTAAVLHLFNHALMKGALFLALGAVTYKIGAERLADFRGLSRRMPWTTSAIVVGGLSLVGVPPTAGFVSKWYLVFATLEQGLWPLALLVLLGSVMALVYVWRILEAAYFGGTGAESRGEEAPLSMLLPVGVLTIANLYFGIHTEVTVGLARQAATLLMGSAS